MRILIAEDDNISRIILKGCLEQLSHQVTEAVDGGQAWKLWQAAHYDVLITDMQMPGLTGLQLIGQLRHAHTEQYTYCIIMTAFGAKSDFVIGMEAGADDFITKPVDRETLHAHLLAAERVVSVHRELLARKAELERLNRVLYETGRIDKLTGVNNRLRMEEDLQTIHSRMERYGHAYCLAIADIDFFKSYNDTLGHPAGDVCLRAVAQSLVAQARAGDQVYRYGGEEFLIVLPEQDAERGAIALERMRVAVEDMAIPHPAKGPNAVVTISAGISAMAPGDRRTLQEIINAADAALYQAKNTGRNRVVFLYPDPPLSSTPPVPSA